MKGLCRSSTRGSAAVEFALVLPLLLVVGLALLQVGLLTKDQLIVQEAARAGARQAAVSRDDGSVREAVSEAAGGLDLSLLTTVIARDDSPAGPATVTVTYDAPIAVPMVRWLFPSVVRLSARATMRQEGGGP
jgi:Flp pilus assembly protein TadG